MKTVRQILAEGKTVSYAAHNDFGSPAQKVLARRSGSSAGGSAGGMDEDKTGNSRGYNVVYTHRVTGQKLRTGLLTKDGAEELKKQSIKQGDKNVHLVYHDNKTPVNEDTLEEGNPLSTMHKHQEAGRHFIAISTERPDLSKKEVKVRNAKLVASARAAGFGVRKAEGRYEGGKESSHIIHAKEPGKEAGAELVAFGRKMGQEFDQDSILHHNGKTARLIGTNETGFPGKGNSEKVGNKLKFNNPESPFQTELRPSKKKAPARFTTE